ncbi:MAG: hypothetical protein GWP62_00215 [Gammaproteobacteria bacterium]|jgi:hypothetical protein|nr:hypothetical protein [Gammaproteobacteria bacterium]
MNRLVQVVLYAAFAVGIGYFSLSPPYQYADEEMASIKLSLSHAAKRVEDCVKLTPDEINRRALAGEPISECGRERLPLTIELEIDGVIVFRDEPLPSGLWSDGPASVYERFELAPGPHIITARLRDTAREHGWDYSHSDEVVLLPGRYFSITFRAETGGFRYR